MSPSQRAINVVTTSSYMTRVRTSGDRRHTRAHIFGEDTSALQKREDHANSIFAPWWNDHTEEEGIRVCAYLTQMLKLSYALQYHRELIVRRIDGPTRKRSPILRLCVCTRILLALLYIRCNLFRETAITFRRGEWEGKRGGETEEKIKFKLEL